MAIFHHRISLFRNRWLEKLTIVSAPAFIVIWTVCLAYFTWTAWSLAPPSPALMAVGTLLWTLVEYVLHRYVFHWKPASATLKQMVFVMHGNHHAVPNDPLRNLMPPIVSLPINALIWAGMIFLAGPSGSWLFLGFAVGYVIYDLVHYACHQWTMKGRFLRALKMHHMRHHHQLESGNFAITGMLWDRLFGTLISTTR